LVRSRAEIAASSKVLLLVLIVSTSYTLVSKVGQDRHGHEIRVIPDGVTSH